MFSHAVSSTPRLISRSAFKSKTTTQNALLTLSKRTNLKPQRPFHSTTSQFSSAYQSYNQHETKIGRNNFDQKLNKKINFNRKDCSTSFWSDSFQKTHRNLSLELPNPPIPQNIPKQTTKQAILSSYTNFKQKIDNLRDKNAWQLWQETKSAAKSAGPKIAKSLLNSFQNALLKCYHNFSFRKFLKYTLLGTIIVGPLSFILLAIRVASFVFQVNFEHEDGFYGYAKANHLEDLYSLPLQTGQPLTGEVFTENGYLNIDRSFPKIHKLLIRQALVSLELATILEDSAKRLRYYLLKQQDKYSTENQAELDAFSLRQAELLEFCALLDGLRFRLHSYGNVSLYLYGRPSKEKNRYKLGPISRFILNSNFVKTFETIHAAKLALKQAATLGLYINSMNSTTWRDYVPKEYQSLFGYHQFLYFAGTAAAKKQEAVLKATFDEQYAANKAASAAAMVEIMADSDGDVDVVSHVDPDAEFEKEKKNPVLISPDFIHGPLAGLNWEPMWERLRQSEVDCRVRQLILEGEQKKLRDSQRAGENGDENGNDEDCDENIHGINDPQLKKDYKKYMEDPNRTKVPKFDFETCGMCSIFAPMLTPEEKRNLTMPGLDQVIDIVSLPFDKFNFHYVPPTEGLYEHGKGYRVYSDLPEFLWRYTPALPLPTILLDEFIDQVHGNPPRDYHPRPGAKNSFKNLQQLPRPYPIQYDPQNDAICITQPEVVRQSQIAFEWQQAHGEPNQLLYPPFGTVLQVPYQGQKKINDDDDE
jgi:hypothetical protein